jgi:hypothetical protein
VAYFYYHHVKNSSSEVISSEKDAHYAGIKQDWLFILELYQIVTSDVTSATQKEMK